MKSIGIIGSGHTGIAVARALAERGYRPVIFDVGETLDPRRQEIVTRLGQQPKTDWDPGDIENVFKNDTIFDERPKRLAFGSDFIYAYGRPHAPLEVADGGPSPTFARGGFSSVWGATMLPAADCDTADWPFSRSDLAPYYEFVLQDMPLSAVEDSLLKNYPLYKSDLGPVDLTPNIKKLLNKLSGSRALNDRNDVAFGRARVAVRSEGGANGHGCVYCGRCFSGCVYGAIHTSTEALSALERTGKVEYLSDSLVTRIWEDSGAVGLTCKRGDGSSEDHFLSRVFVAAGAINSTRLVMESKNLLNRPVVMKSTQGFVVPMLSLWGAPFPWPDANTLTGAFLDFKVPGFPEHWVHTQVNSANEIVLARLGFEEHGRGVKQRILRTGLGRLFIGICNIHSDHAGRHELSLTPAEHGARHILKIETKGSELHEKVARQAGRRLFSLMSRVGVIPLLPFVVGNPKRPMTWHFGGTLPMSTRPQGEYSTDLLGRPRGWERVHVVDSSIFPSIPSTTVALLAMANAVRIAKTVDLD